MHPQDHLPQPAAPAVARLSFVRGAALLLATLGFVVIAMKLVTWANEPITSPTTLATSTSASPPPPPTFPSELLAMAVAVSTSLAPSPTPPEPTPTYEMLPTPQPLAVCLTSTPKGEICTQPKAPLPTATPVLPCPVNVGAICVSQGGPVRWLTATPTWAANMTSGSSN